VFFASLYFSRTWTLPYVARFLDVSELPKRTYAVMILGGGNDTRPFVAAALVKAKLAEKVLLVTTRFEFEAEDGSMRADHEITINVLLARGVPRDDIIVLPGFVENTFDEAQALAKYLEKNPECSVCVVTTSWHTRRAKWVFDRTMKGRFSPNQFVAAPTERFDENNWWTTEQGVYVVDEYLKLAYYWLKYY
jgi:uncharacterized SAM-binding protein YcdF (DUF218 family)